MTDMRPMSTAPLDGTPIQVEIPGHGADNIVFWMRGLMDSEGNECGGWAFAEDQEPPPCWTDGICWENNEDENASIPPIGWKPIPGKEPILCPNKNAT